MSGPWEKYQSAPAGPWEKYQTAEPQSSKGPPRRYVKDKTASMGGGELAGQGALKFLRDLATGFEQRWVSGEVAQGNPGAAEAEAFIGTRVNVDRVKDRRLMEKGAAQAGYVGGALATTVPATFLPGANTVAGAAGIGGVMGALQPTAEGEDWRGNAAKGAAFGAAGQGAFNALARVAGPVKSSLNAAQQRAVELLRRKGVAMSAGQQTGSRTIQATERMLGDSPAAAGKMAEMGDKFRRSFTRAALRTAGINSDSAAPEVLGAARTRIGGVFDDVASRYELDVTAPDIANKLNAIGRQAKEELLNDERIGIQIAKIREAATEHNGKLKGEAYQNIKTSLDNLSRQPGIAPIAAELRAVLDDALMKATAGTRDFARLKEARAQYRNLMALSDVADTTADGLITPARLAQRLKSGRHTRNSMRYDKGDAELSRLARAGSTVTDRFPNSGTAARAAGQLTLPTLAGAGSLALSGDPMTALGIAGTTWAAPKIGAALATSPRVANYLASGIGPGAVRNTLMFPSQRALGTAVPAYLLAQE
jgi:hypothetical protein